MKIFVRGRPNRIESGRKNKSFSTTRKIFVLGALTTRASSTGAIVGAALGTTVMLSLWAFTGVNGYLYTTSGIATCVIVGYLVSVLSRETKDLTGLTIHTLAQSGPSPVAT